MADFVDLAFELAFKYRNPAMILSDGVIGQMMEKVELPPYKAYRKAKTAEQHLTGLIAEASRNLDYLFDCPPPKPGRTYDVLAKGVEAIREANVEIGLAISEPEMKYLAESFKKAGRNPTDTELVMFGQVNSEHCRHKIFGAEFIINGKKQKDSLFGMIKNTHKKRPQDTLSAYKDNSAVVAGFKTDIFAIDPKDNSYSFKKDQLDQLMKVETHNHPTTGLPQTLTAITISGAYSQITPTWLTAERADLQVQSPIA